MFCVFLAKSDIFKQTLNSLIQDFYYMKQTSLNTQFFIDILRFFSGYKSLSMELIFDHKNVATSLSNVFVGTIWFTNNSKKTIFCFYIDMVLTTNSPNAKMIRFGSY